MVINAWLLLIYNIIRSIYLLPDPLAHFRHFLTFLTHHCLVLLYILGSPTNNCDRNRIWECVCRYFWRSKGVMAQCHTEAVMRKQHVMVICVRYLEYKNRRRQEKKKGSVSSRKKWEKEVRSRAKKKKQV